MNISFSILYRHRHCGHRGEVIISLMCIAIALPRLISLIVDMQRFLDIVSYTVSDHAARKRVVDETYLTIQTLTLVIQDDGLDRWRDGDVILWNCCQMLQCVYIIVNWSIKELLWYIGLFNHFPYLHNSQIPNYGVGLLLWLRNWRASPHQMVPSTSDRFYVW